MKTPETTSAAGISTDSGPSVARDGETISQAQRTGTGLTGEKVPENGGRKGAKG